MLYATLLPLMLSLLFGTGRHSFSASRKERRFYAWIYSWRAGAFARQDK
jgi:hypothetical protein